jgi:hypothetical protein
MVRSDNWPARSPRLSRLVNLLSRIFSVFLILVAPNVLLSWRLP